ncbi:protein translocase subunit SecD [Govanella unica]|uniref:Protein translocase subunit SecD n=1 Tax=Govanella unica TaxID=2975056 RepID=A0A9X3Z775_9PROT|nr:protein translocase subunit SecD [Govania unica]MDA5193950.1 protein translocase subunit SecD [Govania unica]
MLAYSRWQVAVIIAICLAGLATLAPNFFSRETVEKFPSWLPSKQLSLGLDLQGGAHLLFEVDTNAVIKDRLEAITDDVRTALRPKDATRIDYSRMRVDGTSVRFDLVNPADRDRAMTALKGLISQTVSGLGAGGPDLEIKSEGDRGIQVSMTDAAIESRKRSAVDQSIEIVRRRVDELGTKETSIQKQGADRILVQVPGVQDVSELVSTINTTAQMSFRMVDLTASVDEALRGRVPVGSEILDAMTPEQGEQTKYLVRKRVLVSGDSLVDAQPSFHDGQPVVSFRFDSAGGKRFAEATRSNVGRPFAIVLDNKVISAPRINEPILGGSGQISGNFTVESANKLAVLLRAGALPAPLKILEQRTIGPDLGADSVAAGKLATIIGTVAVIVFMVVYYGWFGMVANIALVFNIVLLLGALSVLGATLTLPGIAGIVLTIGVAVDANVLMYERMREEVRNGKTPVAAAEAGFSRVMMTLWDTSITHLISAGIMFELGGGPVRGFAVTLSIGVITSLFTAVCITRLIVSEWVHRVRPKVLPI